MIGFNTMVQAVDNRGQVFGFSRGGCWEPVEEHDSAAVAAVTLTLTIHVNILMPIDATILFIFIEGATPYPVISMPLVFGTPCAMFTSGDDSSDADQ